MRVYTLATPVCDQRAEPHCIHWEIIAGANGQMPAASAFLTKKYSWSCAWSGGPQLFPMRLWGQVGSSCRWPRKTMKSQSETNMDFCYLEKRIHNCIHAHIYTHMSDVDASSIYAASRCLSVCIYKARRDCSVWWSRWSVGSRHACIGIHCLSGHP